MNQEGAGMTDNNEKIQANNTTSYTTLEEVVANTCSCKLRTICPDKHSSECLKDRNLYQEFMLARAAH